MTDARPRRVRFADLGLRAASGVALALVALLNVWAGGFWAVAFLSLALVLMLWEYHRMVTGEPPASPGLIVPAVAGVAALVATELGGAGYGIATLLVGALATAAVSRPWPRLGWLTGGYLYMALAMGALLVLRAKEPDGVLLIVWLVLVVVVADVGAYFAGRSIGGPKLWVRVSPGKTWSGAIGGLVFAGLAGLAFALSVGWNPVRIGCLSLGIAVCSQAGDLLESAVKRRFGVKDASNLIPGHGGVMDRLDGIMGGVWFFAIADSLGVGVIGP